MLPSRPHSEIRRSDCHGSASYSVRPSGHRTTPLIDPKQDNADDPEFLRQFKQLVNDDYNFAEALYAGGVFAVLLFFSQQGVSVYKHCVAMPDAACPWASGSVDAFSNFPT